VHLGAFLEVSYTIPCLGMNMEIPDTVVQARDSFEDSMDILAFVVELGIADILLDCWDSMQDRVVEFVAAGTAGDGAAED
jgi:hypothetical protein